MAWGGAGPPEVVGVSQHSISVSDEELNEYLDDVENKSEVVREALRMHRAKNDLVDDHRLSDAQVKGYDWMRRHVGINGRMPKRMVKSPLAEHLKLGKKTVEHFVLRPLARLGYIAMPAGLENVAVVVRPPDVAESAPEVEDEATDPEDAGDRLDELDAAGQEVAEGAD